MWINIGKGYGLALIIKTIVTLIIAWLFVKQSASLSVGTPTTRQEERQNPIDHAQGMVDLRNQFQSLWINQLTPILPPIP